MKQIREQLMDLLIGSLVGPDDPSTICLRLKTRAMDEAWGKNRQHFMDLLSWADAVHANLPIGSESINESSVRRVVFDAPIEALENAIGEEVRIAMQANLDRKRNADDFIARTLGN